MPVVKKEGNEMASGKADGSSLSGEICKPETNQEQTLRAVDYLGGAAWLTNNSLSLGKIPSFYRGGSLSLSIK